MGMRFRTGRAGLRRRVVVGALALASLALTEAPRPLEAQLAGLSEDEIVSLEHGELVVREWRETRGQEPWIGGVSYLRVWRPPAEVWRAIHDVARWHAMLPSATESRPDDAAALEPVVEIQHAYGPLHAGYSVRARFDERARRCAIELLTDRPHDIGAGHALIEVHRWRGDGEGSLVVWAFLVEPGDGLAMPLVVDAIQHWAVRVPTTLRAFLDGPGAELYR
jgi:hypothetical protein